MKIDLAPIIEVAKKALRCKSEFDRLDKGKVRIYQLSRMLPEEEGLELLELYEQTKDDVVKIQTVIHEE